jgi:PAS domain S-box-containing protein
VNSRQVGTSLADDDVERGTGNQIEQERFQIAVEAAAHGMALVDHHGTIVLTNENLATMFGYKRDELTGQLVEMLVPTSSRGAHQEYRNQYFKEPDARMLGRGREVMGLAKDGREIPVEIGLYPVQTTAGRYVLCSVVDITERRQAEDLRETKLQIRLARAIQQDLLPQKAPHTPGFDIAGAAYPADDTGGDCFDFISWRDGSVGLVVADVAGHGIASALLMAVNRHAAYARAPGRGAFRRTEDGCHPSAQSDGIRGRREGG